MNARDNIKPKTIRKDEAAVIYGKSSETVTKVQRYGWTIKDAPGRFLLIDKLLLKISEEYQRDIISSKILEISSAWSWISLGVIIVGFRDGCYYVIDGQHRTVASLRRADVTTLPCLVFETDSVNQEAIGFLGLNTGRKPVSAIGKQKALVASGDETAVFVNKLIEDFGMEVKKTASKYGDICCISWLMRRAKEDKQRFIDTFRVACILSEQDMISVQERLLEGLWIMHGKFDGGLDNKPLLKRLKQKGARALLDAATRASAYYSRGGGAIWANGMLEEMNKGLHWKLVGKGV